MIASAGSDDEGYRGMLHAGSRVDGAQFSRPLRLSSCSLVQALPLESAASYY